MTDDRGAGSGLIAPECCGISMVLVAAGRAANFDIGLWRCLTCERHEQTTVRPDGETFGSARCHARSTASSGEASTPPIDGAKSSSSGSRGLPAVLPGDQARLAPSR
jgi:hypothetical protein